MILGSREAGQDNAVELFDLSAARLRSSAPERGVPMARDPVCGTFVLPDRAVKIADGRTHLFFCSEACRDKYRARSA